MRKYVHPDDRDKKKHTALLKDVRRLRDLFLRIDKVHWEYFERWEAKALAEAGALVDAVIKSRTEERYERI